MFNIGPEKLMVVLLVALIVLGPDKLPNAARQIGRYLSDFRRISQGFQQELRSAIDMAADPVTSFTEATPTDPPSAPAAATLPDEGPPPDDPSDEAAAAAEPVPHETSAAAAPAPEEATPIPEIEPIPEPDRTASA